MDHVLDLLSPSRANIAVNRAARSPLTRRDSGVCVYWPASRVSNGRGCGWLLEFYVLTTSEVRSGQVSTSDTHVDFIVLPQGNLAWAPWPISHSVTLFWHWPNQYLPYPINAELGSNKHQFDKSLVWVDEEPNSRSPSRTQGPRSTIFQ